MISSKRITALSLALTLAVLIFTIAAFFIKDTADGGNAVGKAVYGNSHSVVFSDDDYYSDYAKNGIAKISLTGDTVTTNSRNVSIDGNKVTILGGGTYVISGSLSGSITVNSEDSAAVRLVLSGAEINSENSAAIYIKQAEKTIISLFHGTENILSDGEIYEYDEGENVTAAIYSRDDLTVNGTGTLRVTGNYSDGIKCNDTLKITGGNIAVTAVDDGINANDCIAVRSAKLEIDAGGDAVKCESEDAEKGFIVLESSELVISSGSDGIYSSSAIYASSINADVTSGGGAESVQLSVGGRGSMGFGGAVQESTVSKKGIKAGEGIVIDGGGFILNCEDDGIHSDGDITVKGGSFEIASGNDAVHAEKNLYLAPGFFTVTKCLEGIEGGYITIDSGEISVISADDAINAVGEGTGGFGGMARPGASRESLSEEDIYLKINGGKILLETGGDGIDSNGGAEINGGSIEVYGPEDNGNSSLDFQYGLLINGGSVLAAGSAGMAESPSGASAQRSIVFRLDKTYDAGSSIELRSADGGTVVSGTPAKRFGWVLISSDGIAQGVEYTLYINGDAIETAIAEDTVTSVGTSSGRRW